MIQIEHAEQQLRQLVFDVATVFPGMKWKSKKGWPLPSYIGRCRGHQADITSSQATIRGGKFEPLVNMKITVPDDARISVLPLTDNIDLLHSKRNRRSKSKTYVYTVKL